MITKYYPDAIKRSSRGFTLLELSIVLLIMSLVLGTTLGFLAEKTDADKIKETERRMDYIEKAIAQFVVKNKYIPCPALAPANPNGTVMYAIQGGVPNTGRFGVAINSLVDPTMCEEYSGSPFGNDPDRTNTGAVPTQTLQIPDEYAFDAWGRRITYVMSEHCRDPSEFVRGYANDCNASFTIRDASGASKATNGIIVLISHGKNGHGAFPHHGGTTRVWGGAGVSADEALNGRLTSANVFQANNGVFVQKSRTNDFDDIVRYETRAQIVKETGGMNGMGGSLIATDSIDPLCRMIDSKLGAVYPALPATTVPPSNPPLLATTQSICGLTTVAQQTASSCDDYMFALANFVYGYCY